MTREDVIDRLRGHKSELRRLGVERLYLFGSMACNAARQTSDIDLFFDHARGKLGIFEVMDVQERTTNILGRTADVTTRASLHPVLRQEIEASAIRVF